MKNKKDSFKEFTFREEVSEKNLYDKKNIEDIIYVKDSGYYKKISVLVCLAIFFIISALLFSLFGMAYANKNYLWIEKPKELITYNLFVAHSNSYYGRQEINFETFSTEDKALQYNFEIKNQNPVDLNYKVFLRNPYHEQDMIDMTLINYKLFVNNRESAYGKLENDAKITLCNNNIVAGETHKMILKLWSSELKKDKEFNFKIDVMS